MFTQIFVPFWFPPTPTKRNSAPVDDAGHLVANFGNTKFCNTIFHTVFAQFIVFNLKTNVHFSFT